ncbi:hypothetical protein DYB25_006843 [Aphanomyces astaci]|uniref:HEAT repeat-containing protein 1 n=1 Tax=Aphanomyces astaci TaxID=112090 RepID=A0A397BAX1_APHAT|nr:hypothetical protein DYB25_006843 [Aphanomyces astaci]
MSTSLASQLNALKVHATSAPSQRKLASFLHEPKVASKIDIRTTYEHAKQALDHLCGMDGSLDVFHTTLLHPSKVQAQFNRALLTKDENAAVDVDLGLLLDALSPYFLLPPTHQLLEYLIRRYEIHTWNVEQILGATLCYHESPVFARLVTICDLNKYPRWAFLEAVKVNNVPLLRANLAKRCFTDPSIVRFIYDAGRRIGAKNPKLMALYTLLAMEVLDKSKISDQILRWVLPNVLDGLRDRTFPEHQLSSYMVATKLTSKAVLAHVARTQIVSAIAKTALAHAQLDALLCLVSVVQAQPFEALPIDVVKHLLNYTDVPQLLRDATDAYDTRKFLTLFFAGLVSLLVDSAKTSTNQAETTVETTLFAILAELGPDSATLFVAPIVGHVLKSARVAASSKDKNAVAVVLQRVLVRLSKRFAEQLDAGLHALLSADDDDEASAAFYIEFVGRTFDGTTAAVHVPLAQSGLSLLLSLDHPNADIRLHAVTAVKAMNDSFDEVDALLRRLNDDSPAVVLQVLQLNVLLAKATPLALVEAVAHAVSQRFADPQFKVAVPALVGFATGPLLTKYPKTPRLTPIVLDMLLQFAPTSDWLEPSTSSESVIPFDAWVQHLKKLHHPFGQALKAPKDLSAVVQAWGKVLTDDLVDTVAAWTAPAPFRHVRLPYLALQVFFHSPKKQSGRQFLPLARTEWTLLNNSPAKVDLAIHRPAILHVIEMICASMTASPADEGTAYDDALHLLLHSSSRFFTLVQPYLHDKLAKHNWTTLLHSLCRVASSRADTQATAAVRGLTLVSVMLECHGSTAIKLNDLHQVLTTVLLSLHASDTAVRKVGVQTLKPLAKVSVDKQDKAALATYHKAMAALTQAKTELVMDSQHLPTLLATLLDDNKLDAGWTKQVLATVLVKGADGGAIPAPLQRRARQVLEVFAKVQLPALWESAVGWFTHRLPLAAQASCSDAETAILNHLLGHFLTTWATSKVPKAVVDAVVLTLATPTGVSALHKHVAATMPATWFASVGSATQSTIVAHLVALMRSGEELSEISSQLVPRLQVSADIVAKLLQHQKSPHWVADVTCVLEVLPAWLPRYSATELENLLTPLQHIVAHFSQDKVSEYSVQMVLTVLHQTCRLLPPAASAKHPSKKHATATTTSHAKVLVELTMEVVEVTTSPQTRNAALLLVSALVDLYPAQVLTSLVPILSHASHLHMDEYSFHVLREIVQHAVPYVAKPSSPISIQQFLQTFVDAFGSIPAARRLDLFHVVLASLDLQNANALGMTIALLLLTPSTDAQHPHAAFCHELAQLFPPEAQMQALVFLVHSTSHLQDDTDPVKSDTSVLNVQGLSDAKLAATTAAWLSFVPHHLERKRLHAQILDKQHGDNGTLQEAYLLLAQALLLYLRRGSDDALGGFALDGMHNLQRLLTAPGFVAVIGELLHHEDSVIRRRALQLLNERIEAHQDSLTTEEELLFVDMLADLTEVLGDVQAALVSDLQMALLSVDVLTRFFAKKHPKTFQAILPTVIACTTHTNGHVSGSAFVCLSNLTLALGAAVFPHVPTFFPTLLSALEQVSSHRRSGHSTDQADDSSNTLQHCGMVALRNLTAKIPQFLAPYLNRMLALLFQPSLHPQIQVTAQATLVSLAHGMELRNLLPALLELYPSCCRHGNDSLLQLFDLVATIVGGMDRLAVKTHLSGWMRFFLMAMDVRRTHPLLSIEVEDKLRHAIVQLVLKLSEKQLKPLFLKFVAWVDVVLPGHQGPSLPRQAVFYRLVGQLSAQLRSIFVPYYAHILPQCASIVAWGPTLSSSFSTANDEEDDGFFKRPAKKQKVAKEVEDDTSSLKATVAEFVVQALVGCFSHDSEGFMDKEKFDEIMPGLVDLLDVAESQPTLVSHAVTALAQLAWAAKSDLLWKPMHHRILMKSRSDSAGVRLAALRAIEQCYTVVGEEFLAMLPESIPFLAELLEDTDATVETLCHQVIKQIEDISGESLDQYLTA